MINDLKTQKNNSGPPLQKKDTATICKKREKNDVNNLQKIYPN